jgi:putative nucleotidyltransferase with HDIG domain
MPNKPIKLPAAMRQLPPMPKVLTRALTIIRDPRSRRSELANVLALDQGLTGLFLRMVNSAYYGLPRRITSLDEAIGYLGFNTVQETILAVSVNKLLTQPVPAYQLERAQLWHHSVAVATGGDWIAHRRGITPYSDIYVAGLLHDVGKLALDIMLEHKAKWQPASIPDKAANGSHKDEVEQAELEAWTEFERRTTGYQHAEVSAVVVRSWNLPDRVVEAIACHHTPESATLDRHFTAAVHIADAAALMAGIGLGIDGLQYPLVEAAVTDLEWNDAEMAQLMLEMQRAVSRAEEIVGTG